MYPFLPHELHFSEEDFHKFCFIFQESIAKHDAYIESLDDTKDGPRHVTPKERVLRAQQWLADSGTLSPFYIFF